MRDIIHVHNLESLGHHGVYDDERAEGRRFALDIDVEADTSRAGSSDTLGDTIDYRDIATIALDVMNGPSRHLIEKLAAEICRRILDELPLSASVRITVRKHATGVPGSPEWVGLTLVRSRQS